MQQFRKWLVLALAAGFVILGSSATRIQNKPPRNLKVLPKDINDVQLDSIMNSYTKALHVDCDFCHGGPGKPDDFAADRNPMKEQARKMIGMTQQINRDYFRFDTLRNPAYFGLVSCITCHRENPMPVDIH